MELATTYDRDGIVFPLRAMPGAEADALATRYDALTKHEGGRTARRFAKKPHLVLPWLDAVVRHPAVLAPVTALLGPDLLCWSSMFFAKAPGTGDFVAWHQDATYWGLSSADVATAWIAFTPSTRESGCMRVVPGTHHEEQLPHRSTDNAANMLSRSQELAVQVDPATAVDVVLQPGEMSIHHVRLVHGSEPNRAALPRVGFAIRYIAGHVRQTAGDRDSAMLVAGRDHGTFDLEPPPRGELDPDAIAVHARMLSDYQATQAAIM